MLKSLYWKLTLAFALIAFLTAALVALSIRLTSAIRFSQFIIEQQRSNLEQALQDYYASNGSWEGVVENWGMIQSSSFPTPPVSTSGNPPENSLPPREGDRRNLFGLADTAGKVLVSVDQNYPPGFQLPSDVLKEGTPILVDGKQVGMILTAQKPPGFNPQEAQFLQRTNEALIFAGLGALLVSLVLGILLARTLTDPLKALTKAAQNITHGQLEQQVRVTSNDEIGQLATAFNKMSQEVARVNLLRRQMTADIAHDLRTPLTVIAGYIESMRDEVLKPTPERFSLIYSEVERLQKLVGDLRMLSMADAGELSLNPRLVSPQDILDRTATLFRYQAEQKQVEIQVVTEGNLPEIRVDEDRMMQVMDNLISNALRYTPPGGKITLSTKRCGQAVEICVQDNGEGIAAEELPYIFDRFHRVDKSRHSESGESGLGLAIVKALVEAHGGSISAESTLGQGTIIQMLFDIDGKTSVD